MPFWILPRYPEPFSCALPNLQRFPCFNIQEKWDALLYKSSLERGRKPLVIEGKAPSSWRENNGKEIALPDRLAAQVRSKGKSSLLPPPALHHCCGSLQPPRSSSSGLSPAAQCCCGIGNLLWLRKIMGICFSKPKKSQTKFRREKKKKYKTSWSYWRSSWHFPAYATILFGISWFYDQKIYHIMFMIVVFAGSLVVRGGTVSTNRQTREAMAKITSLTDLKAFQEIARLESFFFRILKTYRNHI